MLLFDRTGAGAGYERLVVLQDAALGLRAILAIHSTRRGPAFGGIRRALYPDDHSALVDVLALAESMSLKCALADLPAGGGKTVVAMPNGGSEPDWAAVYAAIGRAVEELGGAYVCGPDVGTGPEELAWVRAETQWVNPAANDAGASTAAGVLAGLRAVWTMLGDPPADARTVAVQGLGQVGLTVARGLREQGVRVIAADPRRDACKAARELGVEIVELDAILETPCDVLMPCALGGVFTASGVRKLRCRAICGSANNQLVDDEVATRLHEADILLAPDIVVSAGAVIEGVMTVRAGQEDDVRAAVQEAIDRLETITLEILEESKRRDEPPTLVARRRAWANIDGDRHRRRR